MAQAWRIGPSSIGFNLDEPEEIRLLAAYAALRARLGAAEPWVPEFERMFLSDGKGVSDKLLAAMNAALRRIGREPVRPVISSKSEYCTTRGAVKSAARRAVLEKLADPLAAEQMLAEAEVASMYLPPVRDWERQEQEALFAEAEARMRGIDQGRPGLTPDEQRARRVAADAASPQAAPGPIGPVDVASVPGMGPQPELPGAFRNLSERERRLPAAPESACVAADGPRTGEPPADGDAALAALRRLEAAAAGYEAKLAEADALLVRASRLVAGLERVVLGQDGLGERMDRLDQVVLGGFASVLERLEELERAGAAPGEPEGGAEPPPTSKSPLAFLRAGCRR